MSGAPKRVAHEEGGMNLSSSSMRPGFGGEEEETPGGFPRLNYGPVQESRTGLMPPRPESRDGDRRSPLHSIYKMPSSSMTDATHPVAGGPEIRAESRDSKDVRENKGMESSRDLKVESRDVHHQVVKVEKESRVDESKEVKYDREARNDSKNEVKSEKDVYGVAGNHSNWKEQRGKKHSEVPGGGGGGGGMASFWMNNSQLRPKYDAARDNSVSFLRSEMNDAVGENRLDLKGDEKYKDKERKRKEGKHHDWPESDKDRSDYKNNVQLGSCSNNDFKEGMREDKETEQWGRERKDVLKEKERPKEREKDHVDREGRNGLEREGYYNEKEIADKTSVQENFSLEQKKPTDSWRNMEREAKERRKERDGDIEGERPEKRNRGCEKESDEGGADVDGATDRDRDAFSYGVQQRKRMLRPRGSPQVANRDGRFKSRGQDGEG